MSYSTEGWRERRTGIRMVVGHVHWYEQLNIYIYFHGVTWIIMRDGRGSAVEELLVVSLGQHDCC